MSAADSVRATAAQMKRHLAEVARRGQDLAYDRRLCHGMNRISRARTTPGGVR